MLLLHCSAYSRVYCSLTLINFGNFGLMLNCFGPVRSIPVKILSCRSGVGAIGFTIYRSGPDRGKDNGAFWGRGAKNLAPQDSNMYGLRSIFLEYYWILTQQYSTNENPSLSRNNFLANLMHGHSDSSWSGSSLPEITEQRIFHVLFYCEQIRQKCIINCIYPSWLNF